MHESVHRELPEWQIIRSAPTLLHRYHQPYRTDNTDWLHARSP